MWVLPFICSWTQFPLFLLPIFTNKDFYFISTYSQFPQFSSKYIQFCHLFTLLGPIPLRILQTDSGGWGIVFNRLNGNIIVFILCSRLLFFITIFTNYWSLNLFLAFYPTKFLCIPLFYAITNSTFIFTSNSFLSNHLFHCFHLLIYLSTGLPSSSVNSLRSTSFSSPAVTL